MHSPLGCALLGKEIGDVCEVVTPRGNEELTVMSLEGES
ncbi:MAG: GreA/GreB family elongation factor [Polyangiaceae bacterium]